MLCISVLIYTSPIVSIISTMFDTTILYVGFSTGTVSPVVLSPWCRQLWVQCDNC